MVRPYKRRRVSEHDSPTEIFERRARLDLRLKSRFESIFEKYGKDFSGIGDEIDLETGEIVVNHGHVDGLRDETDPGRPEDLFDELNPDEESSTPIIRLTRTSSHYTRQIVSTMRITSQLDAESVDDIDDLGLEFSDMKRRVLASHGRMSLPNQVGLPHLAKSDSKIFYKSRQSYPPIAVAAGPPALEPLCREAMESQWWVPQLPKSSVVTQDSVLASPCLPLQDDCDRAPSPPCYSIWSCKEASSVYRNGDSVLSKQSISISAKAKTLRAAKDERIDNISSSTIKDHAPPDTRKGFHRKAQEKSDKLQTLQTRQKSTFRFARIPIKVVKPPIQPKKTAKPQAQNITLKITRSQAHRKDSLTSETENTSLESAVQQEYIPVVSHKSKQWKRNIHGRLVMGGTYSNEEISNGLVKKTAVKVDEVQGKPAKDSRKARLQTIPAKQAKQARALHGEGLKPAEENTPDQRDGIRGTLPRTMSKLRVEDGSAHRKRRCQQKESLKSLLVESPLHDFRRSSGLSEATYIGQEENSSTNRGGVAQKDEAMQPELKTSPVYVVRRRGRSSKAISESQEENKPVQVTQQVEALKSVVISPDHVSSRCRGSYPESISKSQAENIPVRRNESTQREGALKLGAEISPLDLVKRRGRPPKAIAKSEAEKSPVQLVGAPAVRGEPSAEGNATNSVKFSVQQENVPKPESQNMSVKPQVRSTDDILKSQTVNIFAGANPIRKDMPDSLHAPANNSDISVMQRANLRSERSKSPKSGLKHQVRQKYSLRSQLNTPVKVSRSHVTPRISSLALCSKGKWAVDDLSEDELSTPLKRVGYLEGKALKL